MKGKRYFYWLGQIEANKDFSCCMSEYECLSRGWAMWAVMAYKTGYIDGLANKQQ